MIRSNGRTIASGSSGKTDTARKLHFVLQGKGGVGKTVVALLLAQCIEERGEPVICVDTDPVDASLSSLSVMQPERMSILAGNKADTRALDLFIERLLTEDAHFVVDNGASCFVPVSQYLIENDVAAIMDKAGRQPVVHVVVTGGPGLLDTMKGLAAIAQDFSPSVRIVVWLNEYFGPIVNANGKPFEELPAYTDNRERIFALVRLATLSEEANADLRNMFARCSTFAQALAHNNTDILRVQKSRLFRVKQAVWSQIEIVV
jgi:CobQ/CobB/MinD/ParA nucleotide binding domain